MKRDLKVNYAELRQLQKKIDNYKEALETLETASNNFLSTVEKQKGESFDTLNALWQDKVSYNAKVLIYRFGIISTILENYIRDMQNYIQPKDESQTVRVDRNDIWWNYTQIVGSATDFWDIIGDTGSSPATYDTTYWNSPFKTDEENARDKAAHEAAIAAERSKRQANYNKLQGIRNRLSGNLNQGTIGGATKGILDIYNNNICEYENTDDAYKTKLGVYYDEWASLGTKIGDFAEEAWDLLRGAGTAIKDLVVGVILLAEACAYYALWFEFPEIMLIGTMFGLIPDQFEQNALGFASGIAMLIIDPGQALETMGQQIFDKADEEGIAFSVGYVATDILIEILLEKGLDKLSKTSKAAGVADDVADATKVIDNVDDVIDAAKDIDDVGDFYEGLFEAQREGIPEYEQYLEDLMEAEREPISPSNMAETWQGKAPYTGVDSYADMTVKQGEILYRGEPYGTEYFTTEEAISSVGQDAQKLFEGLQVQKHKVHGYKKEMQGYLFNQDIAAAQGITKANPQFGAGGLPQIFVPYANDWIEKGILIPVKKIKLK